MMSRFLLALCLMLVCLTQVGCYMSRGVSELANQSVDEPQYEIHKRILSAWITNQNELLIYCEGSAHNSGEARYYEIRVPLHEVIYDETETRSNLGNKVKSYVVYSKETLREFRYLVLPRRWLQMKSALNQAPPPGSTPVAIVVPPDGWDLTHLANVPLPEGEVNALFIDRTPTADGPLLVYVANKPIWTTAGRDGGRRRLKSLNRTPFTIERQKHQPNQWMEALVPPAFIVDTALLPIYVPIFFHELKVAIHGK